MSDWSARSRVNHSKHSTLVDCIADSLRQVEGAFSIVMMTRNRIFAARDPHGFRPLAMGRITGVDGAPDTFVFASETCAFDLLHAKYEREVKPGPNEINFELTSGDK